MTCLTCKYESTCKFHGRVLRAMPNRQFYQKDIRKFIASQCKTYVERIVVDKDQLCLNLATEDKKIVK